MFQAQFLFYCSAIKRGCPGVYPDLILINNLFFMRQNKKKHVIYLKFFKTQTLQDFYSDIKATSTEYFVRTIVHPKVSISKYVAKRL